MEKKWEEYTIEEKNELLEFWFPYYSGMPLTHLDTNQFRAIAKAKPDDVFDSIVTNYIINTSMQSDLLLIFMRDNRAEQLFSHSIDPTKLSTETRENYYRIREYVANTIASELLASKEAVEIEETSTLGK